MRKRIVREGGVGLLLVVGLGLFGILILWLRGFGFGRRTYSTVVEFDNVSKMQLGAAVRYRGVEVGRITSIEPRPNSVDVEIEITPTAIIPRDVLIEANQSGIVGETSVDITPRESLPESAETADPLDPNCDRTLILCDGARLQGQTGVSYDQLLRSTLEISRLFGNPEFYDNLNRTVEEIGNAADSVAILSGDLAKFTRSAEQQLTTLSDSVKSVSAAADQIRLSVAQASDRLSLTADLATEELDRTATQFNQLLGNVDNLVDNVDNLVNANRSTIVTTLNNLSETSDDLRATVGRLTPIVNRVEQSRLIGDLEALSANAVETSANLRDLSNEINTPTNLLMIQQTLDSARATFQNVQKITSDLDDLTGDPAFRNNLRNLVNGLSNLVSSTEQLQQQAELAQHIDSVKSRISDPSEIENWYLSNSSSFLDPMEIEDWKYPPP